MTDLTPQERAMLDFERGWWMLGGRKDDLIRARLSMSPSTYYRGVQTLIERDAAFAYDPLTVKRLRRQRDVRRRQRVEGRRADPGSR
ncbi:MAG: hypothetical protein KatS3mg010_0050 [Acidimicrobiia bacterium]|nr:MAG: hypothetical protein KatS3mg010_0050 [Acidimicrobiia bacterium]